MKKAWLVIVVLPVVAFAAWRLSGRNAAAAQEREAGPPARQALDLTVYKDDFGMVHEVRPVRLAQGATKLSVTEVSREMDPQSVLLDLSGGAEVTAHAYDLGAANADALMKRYLGRQVELVRYGQDGHEAERQQGRLAVEAGGDVVVQTDGKYLVHPQGTIVLPADRDVVAVPQLTVQASSPKMGPANLDLTYLTRGLSWSADYVATLSPKDDSLALECWATVTNRTGADYPAAHVTLMAGTPNRATSEVAKAKSSQILLEDGYMRHRIPASMPGSTGAAFAAPEALGDLHAYPVKAATTVVQEQMNRLLMLGSSTVHAKRDYSARMAALSAWDDWNGWGRPEQPARGTVQASLIFYNNEENGLGQPLPQGTVRIYEPDAHGAPRYSGAAGIGDSPHGQRIELTLTRAFDLYTEARVLKSQRLDKHTTRKQVEVILHNEKTSPVTLRVVQAFGSRWKLAGESHKGVRLDSQQAQWSIAIPANGKTTLTYTADLTY